MGKTTVFATRIKCQSSNELIEYIVRGFGLHLKLTVENNTLVYPSNIHLWQVGNLKIPILDMLFLGHATITETALSETEFALDLKIAHL